MALLYDLWDGFFAFLDRGGDVLVPIFVVAAVLWLLLIERFWYMRFTYPRAMRRRVAEWSARPERCSWHAAQVRVLVISEASQRLKWSLPLINTLIALCPLLGLLGTVTGMIEVFNVMALVGSGNARALASGVSMATIPTMSGMVVALSGLYFAVRLERQAKRHVASLEDTLTLERGESCAAA
jgi:biopolymer transport protein ExbB